MPIITVQRRMTPQGNIRIGQKVTGTRNDGSTYTRPGKLEKFRFTSPSQRLIEECAAKYGGEARPWDNDGKAEFEVLSDATAIPVIVVKGGFSQWHEHFTKAGLQHRCDGEKDPAGVYCDPDDPAHMAAIEKPTTRLSVMLEEIESLGVWTLVTRGWNAAAELPSMTELAMHVSDLVPATLGLREKSSVIQTDKGPQTSRYVVPFLDLHVTKKRLVEIVNGLGGDIAALGGASDRPALGAGSSPEAEESSASTGTAADTAAERLPTVSDIAAASTVEVVFSIYRFLEQHNALTDELVEACKARRIQLEPAAPVAQPDGDGVVDAEIVPDGDADAVWTEILRTAGSLSNPMTTSEVSEDFKARMGGLLPDDASAGELQAYLGILNQEPAGATA